MIVPTPVPTSVHYKNLRSIFTSRVWDKIRRAVYARAQHKCEVCGRAGKKHAVECHEVWSYEFEKKIQRLVGFEALCPACHNVRHYMLAEIKGMDGAARNHMMKVNDWTRSQVWECVGRVKNDWLKLETVEWRVRVDTSILDFIYVAQEDV
jgi:hypothetical protein